MINFDHVTKAPVAEEPFKYFVAENVLTDADITNIQNDFPDIRSPGIYPLSEVTCKGNFASLIDDIQSARLESIMEDKYGVDLSDKPLMITIRGRAQKKDGRIHTDAKTKFLTCLLYLNDPWDRGGGRLRLLREGSDMENYIAEVPPNGGTLVSFMRSDNSWHGHKPFEGQRRYVMFNWMTSQEALEHDLGRHRFSAKVKSLNPFA